jgi:thymidylate synthase (FAD)
MVQLIDYDYKILDKIDGKQILEKLEYAGRTCYKSENKGTTEEEKWENTKNFVSNIIKREHTSVLEHVSITVGFIADIGFYKDITRHRAGTAFSIESTRWCRYGKGKNGSELYMMKPVHLKKEEFEEWLPIINKIETAYLSMSSKGAPVDVLRMLLPHSTKATVIMTANLRAWRHILKIRTEKSVHPCISGLLTCLLEEFKNKIPVIFEDIESEVSDAYFTKTIRTNLGHSQW